MKVRMFRMALALVSLLMILTGCTGGSFSLNPQELYALPKLPAKYTELSAVLGEILNSGAEYAPPTSGTNIQSVQLIDLDSDGVEEAVAFLRIPGEEKPLRIYVFAMSEGSYRPAWRMEGSGTSIYSVGYADLDGDGCLEIAVGWKATAELQVLEVYAFDDERVRQLVRTDYVRYAATDLDQDGLLEIVVLHTGEDGNSVADYYDWQEDGSLEKRSAARISVTMSELSQQGRVLSGKLADGEPALYVTGVTASGAAVPGELPMAVTDILYVRGGEMVNLALSMATGVSAEYTPFVSLYPADVNGDGVTELPRVTFSGEETAFRMVTWYQYSASGETQLAVRTCHDLTDGWYLRLPEIWTDRITVGRTVSSGEAAVTFYIRGGTRGDLPFLRISAITGSGREMRSVRGERFILSRQQETIYTGEWLEGGSVGEFYLTDEQIRSAFSLILREWVLGET